MVDPDCVLQNIKYVVRCLDKTEICGESVSELMIVKKTQLQETVHSTVLLGCFYLFYML